MERKNIQRIREYQVLPTNAVIGYGATKRQVITEDTIGTGSDIIRYYRQLEDMDGQVEKQEFSLFPDLFCVSARLPTVCPFQQHAEI